MEDLTAFQIMGHKPVGAAKTIKVKGSCGHTFEATFHPSADLATDQFQCPICNEYGKLEKILSVTVPAKLTIPAED